MVSFESSRILMAIPSINGGSLLARMLPTLRWPSTSIVVLDQGSTDDTAAICSEHGVECVQLHRPHTYTEACNIGIRLARERNADYVCLSNNDIVFMTDVLQQLLTAMDEDPHLGITAPSQVIIDETLDDQPLSYRVCWDLERVDFFHDTHGPDLAAQRLDSDFCELTCALVRVSAIEKTGLLDDEFGFYHEDADLGIRLQKAGYSCAYIPHAQIEHFSSSTFNLEKTTRKASYIAKNRLYFASKHLGFRVGHVCADPRSRLQNPLDLAIGAYLRSYGLLDEGGPELVIGQPGAPDAGYLLTTFAGGSLPAHWAKYVGKHEAILTSSEWTRRLMLEMGFQSVFHIPVGVETDVYHPWGVARPFSSAKTYLLVADDGNAATLAKSLDAWRRFRSTGREASLVLVGRQVINAVGRTPDSSYRIGPFRIATFELEGIEARDILSDVDAELSAELYRAADFTICLGTGARSCMAVLESLACGTPAIRPDYGAAADFDHEHALLFPRSEHDPSAFQPDLDVLERRLEESFSLDAQDYRRLALSGLNMVRGGFTIRHTIMALYRLLPDMQVRDPRAKLELMEKRLGSSLQAISLSGPTSDPQKGMRRASGAVARRVMTMGRLIQQFGRTWQDRDLATAGRMIGNEIRQFSTHRSRHVVRAAQRAGRMGREKFLDWIAPYRRKPPILANAALLVGYIDADLGLGESLRGLARALATTDVRIGIHPFTVGVEGRRSAPFMQQHYDRANRYAVNVIEVAANELATVFDNINRSRFDHSYNILRTYWELSRAPEEWREKLARVDEIWAPNEFVADSFRHIFDKTITVVPPCVEVEEVAIDGRAHFGLDPRRFYFLFSFDYFSFPQRKNPLAVVRAFRKAFVDPATPVSLIVKSTGAVGHFPEIKQYLRDAAREDGRIEIMDRTVDRKEMLALLKSADCYVSMHRAEGFGLGMAEAMAFGRSVIGTGYSGNAEFLTAETGYPIPYRLRPVPADGYVHTDGQVWAEPDEAACAEAMIRVVSEPAEAAARAAAGQQFIARRFGTDNVGEIASSRLKEIFADLGAQKPS
ncbi:MAG: hypothetical protein DCF30_02745 [Hyphomicrobiales bacterium]|nr:MAG: hypothetical protein DCF30_02745 [Hyphomicrobiales bacterium]